MTPSLLEPQEPERPWRYGGIGAELWDRRSRVRFGTVGPVNAGAELFL